MKEPPEAQPVAPGPPGTEFPAFAEFIDGVGLGSGTTLVVFLGPDEHATPAFMKALGILTTIAGAPEVRVVIPRTGEPLERIRAENPRLRVIGLPSQRFLALATRTPLSILIENGIVLHRREGGLPVTVIALLRAHKLAGADESARKAAHRGERLVARIARHETEISLEPDGVRTFFDPASFPWITSFEASWRDIRADLDELLGALERPSGPLNQGSDEGWRLFPFRAFGLRLDENCSRFPATSRLLDTIPGLTTAMFSILKAGTHLPAHRGPFKGVLRYHLGLRVPDRCRLRVGRDMARWEEGRSLVFDDTNEHEAWNDGDETRVVLFVDFLRPLPWPLARRNRALVAAIARSPYIQDARRLNERWESEVGAQVDAARRLSRPPEPGSPKPT